MNAQVGVSVLGKGYPLVLFHGWGFDSKIWSSLLPQLSEQYQLYLVDLPGFGVTSPMGWSVFKEKILAVLPGAFALAGWSMGGLYATRLAIEAPEHVTHLMNIASSPRFLRDVHWPGIEAAVIEAFYHSLVLHPQQTLSEFMQLQLQGQTIPPTAVGGCPSLIGLQEGLQLLLHWDLRPSLTMLLMPVCYLFGRLDTIVSRTTMMAMQKCYPHFQYLLFEQSAHAPFLSHPRAFLMALEDFLK